MKRKSTTKHEYTFECFLKEACKDPKFKKAYDKELKHLIAVHEAIVAYDAIVKNLQPVWDFLNRDRMCKEYMAERKITRPIKWQ